MFAHEGNNIPEANQLVNYLNTWKDYLTKVSLTAFPADKPFQQLMRVFVLVGSHVLENANLVEIPVRSDHRPVHSIANLLEGLTTDHLKQKAKVGRHFPTLELHCLLAGSLYHHHYSSAFIRNQATLSIYIDLFVIYYLLCFAASWSE